MLKDKIKNKEAGIVLYGMTPPKENTDITRVKEIASKHVDRIKSLDIDGVVLYDIQDESARNNDARPFPFRTGLSFDLRTGLVPCKFE